VYPHIKPAKRVTAFCYLPCQHHRDQRQWLPPASRACTLNLCRTWGFALSRFTPGYILPPASAGLRKEMLNHALRANGLFFKKLLPTHLD
jgi:hypothetical protein